MPLARIVILLCAAPFVFGAGLTFLVVDQTGHPVAGCQVAQLRSNEGFDVLSKFAGLVARQLAPGNYTGELACGRHSFSVAVRVIEDDQLEVVSFADRIMRSDHRPPELVVKMDAHPAGIWWMRMTGVYAKTLVEEPFISTKGIEARFADPFEGRYLVTVMSTTGYLCVREIELVEFTRAWTFHPSSCSFDLDRYAHAIERDALGRAKPSNWGRKMEEDKQELFKALPDALQKNPQ